MLYATVGFGGGSTYNALLILTDFDFRHIPIIALSCNIFVVLGNCFRYQLHGLIPWRFSIPLIFVSVPASFIGGSIQVSEMVFMLLLGLGLITSGFLMWISPNESEENSGMNRQNIYSNTIISLLLGFLAGIIGIGGGIFFAPILHLQSALTSKKISAFSSLFILVNSIARFKCSLAKPTRNRFFKVSSFFFFFTLNQMFFPHNCDKCCLHTIQCCT